MASAKTLRRASISEASRDRGVDGVEALVRRSEKQLGSERAIDDPEKRFRPAFDRYRSYAEGDNLRRESERMINVGEVVTDPDFAQTFTIRRSTGSFVTGIFQSTTTDIKAVGTISVANAKEVAMVPEGDVIKGMMVFHSQVLIQATRPKGASDILIWRGEQYRVLNVFPYVDYGYYKALATRMEAAG
jgi:hypothetical protein